MNLSSNALEFLIGWEALRLKAYLDQAGNWTIGIGHLLTPKERESGRLLIGEDLVKWRNGLTREQAFALKQQDLERFECAVERVMAGVPLRQHEFDALVIYAFNIGIPAFERHSSVPKKIAKGWISAAMKAWRAWNKQTNATTGRKEFCDGLDKRRKAEIAMFLNADYSGRP